MNKTIFLLAITIFVTGCNDPRAGRKFTAAAISTVESEMAPLPVQETPTPTPKPDPCRGSDDLFDDVEKVGSMVTKIMDCDKTREYFDMDGKVLSKWSDGDSHEGNTLEVANLQLALWEIRPYWSAFEGLPILTQRSIFEKFGHLAAQQAVLYLHPEHIRSWILDLDWDKDIESLNPNWYKEISWPADRAEPVAIDGYGEVSKLDLWVRMFWRRRGEPVFRRVQQHIQAEVGQS